ncbi:MAG: hypothetical protein JOZ71_05205 [Ktedonobacteraceae bacterium]|nr:hypothetical protein [Ktedonobacteraceae bacterium]
MMNVTRIGIYAVNIDDEGVKVASTKSGTITLTHEDALELAAFILSHRADIETMQQQQAGETIAPPATEPE